MPVGAKALSGARTQIRIGSKVVGWAVGLQADETLNLTAVDVLDDPYTQDLELNSIAVSGSISLVRMYSDGMEKQAQYPQGDKALMILFPEAQLNVVDSLTGNVMFTVHRVKMTGRTMSVSRDGVLMSNVTFRAIKLEVNTTLTYGPVV